MLRSADSTNVRESHPYFEKEAIELYISFLFECIELQEEVKEVFKAPFEREKLYLEVC